VSRLLPALALLLASQAATAEIDSRALAARILAVAATADAGRLDEAAETVPGPVRDDPEWRAAVAARIVALLVRAADLREASSLSPDGAAGLAEARARRESALGELRALVRASPDDPDVLRALAVYYGAEGRLEETARAAALAAGAGLSSDPWLDWAALAASVRGRPPSEAGPLLQAFVATHSAPNPARLSLVRARLASGDRDGALAALDDLLAVVPDHRAAQELKSSLLALPPAEPIVPVVPSGPPPRTAPGHLPRKAAGAPVPPR
jgi:tetratricopeptide (TPR) repeat protein